LTGLFRLAQMAEHRTTTKAGPSDGADGPAFVVARTIQLIELEVAETFASIHTWASESPKIRI